MNVFIAEPSLDTFDLAVPTFPLGTGYVGAYVKSKHPDLNVEIFKAATPLLDAITQIKPEIVALSNYLWNTNTCVAIAEHIKINSPNSIIIFGGPEIDSEPFDPIWFAEKYKNVDLHITHEGEIAFSNFITSYKENSGMISEILKDIDSIGNCFYVDSANRKFVKSKLIPRIDNLNEIESPYLNGMFDKFFNSTDVNYLPLFQTNRGCPFSCTFCQEGHEYHTKVKFFDSDRSCDEISYIAKNIKSKVSIFITDSNWGMYKQDEKIALHIADIMKKFNWPQEIITSSGKNFLGRILNVSKILNGSMWISNSVQSLNLDVLSAIKRRNLKESEKLKYKNELNKSMSEPEIIVPLPNETKKTFVEGVHKLIDSGISCRLKTYQLTILPKSQMATNESVSKYGFKIKYRQHHGIQGYINDNFVCETEKVVISTNTMSEDDVIYCWSYTLLLDGVLRSEPIKEIFRYLDTQKVAKSKFVLHLYESLLTSDNETSKVFRDFREEYFGELFDTEQEVFDYLRLNHQDYWSGKKGGGRLKYCFRLWEDNFSAMFEEVFKSLKIVLLTEKKYDENEFTNLKKFLNYIYQDRIDNSANNILNDTFDYDIIDWFEDSNLTKLNEYKAQTNIQFKATKVSKLEKLKVLQSMGFSRLRDQEQENFLGNLNRLYTGKLRREVSCQ